MTTTASGAPRSRLDPPPVPRRDFLGLAAMWSALVTLGFAALGALRLPRAAVVPVPSRKFRVTLPETLAAGEPYVPPGRSVAVIRNEQGVFAVSMVCTHLGCIVKREGAGFACPCHGSQFALDGGVTKGPAPKALPWLAVTKAPDGSYVVDEATVVPTGTVVRA
ncbi:MAG TPA: Rieske 2Fe-2S domain-containing protein [Candidatus Limnocylindria bacterium]|nr:Rieske 2Fe-2S domain-containing protein [Candidatus Limnocylindria bacterium]